MNMRWRGLKGLICPAIDRSAPVIGAVKPQRHGLAWASRADIFLSQTFNKPTETGQLANSTSVWPELADKDFYVPALPLRNSAC